jgi:phage baseplate assembly protein W
MTTFIGFNTINQNKYFTLTDFELIKRDLLNAFNIRQGQVVGLPWYGTTLWDNLFENQTQDTIGAIYDEVQRVAGGDPRVYISSIEVFPQENGLLIQLELTVVPSTNAQRLNIFFNQTQRVASYV